MKYGEAGAAKAITEYFRDWVGSKVGVTEWWGKKQMNGERGKLEEEAWERMLNLDTSQVTDPGTKEFIEVAYLRSHKHFEQNLYEDKIWDTVMQEIGIEDLREEMKKSKSNKAPGPSGITIEMVKKVDDENLERTHVADSMNKIILGGRHVPATWNKTVLGPLPKSEVKLYEISKTRPIAL